VVYGLDPPGPLDLVPRPLEQRPSADADQRIREIQQLHEKVRARIEKANMSYSAQANKHRRPRVFQPGDLVWIHLRKERFPAQRKTKLMPRADGPFEVLERINDNAYRIDLPGDYGVSATFNVADLSPYIADDYLEDLRANSSQPEENDGGPSLSTLFGPTKAKGKLKDVIDDALEEVQGRGPRTVGCTVVQGPVRHPGFTASALPVFVVRIH